MDTCMLHVPHLTHLALIGMLYSEFDTNLLALTVIPVIGFWKLLPTFGGCVITASSAALVDDRIEMEVRFM